MVRWHCEMVKVEQEICEECFGRFLQAYMYLELRRGILEAPFEALLRDASPDRGAL